MVLSLTGVIEHAQGTGLSSATVQRAQIDHAQINGLFWINAALGLLIFVAIACLAPALAWFYGEPRLVAIGVVLAVVPWIDALGLQHAALLRRAMRFGAIAAVATGALAATRALSIAAALAGLGCWALVLQQVLLACLSTAGLWIASGWRPSRPRRVAALGSLIAFGGQVTLTDLVRHASRSVQEIAVGRFVGARALGLYTRAETLIELPLKLTSPLSAVAVAGLSRLQGEEERYRYFFTRALFAPAAAALPAAAFLLLEAEKVVAVFLGGAWGEAVPVFRLLAPAALAASFADAARWVLLSRGRADRELRWSLAELAVLALAVMLGVRGGLLGVAAGVCAARLALTVPRLVFSLRGSPVRGRDVAGVLWRPSVASAAAVLAAAALHASGMLAGASALVTLLCVGAVFGLAYAGCWLLLPGGPALARSVLAAARG
jgi:PST family polysaccharide transporter